MWSDLGVDIAGFEGLQPAILIAIETHDQADGGSDEGAYFELAVEPTFLLFGPEEDEEGCSLFLSLPTAVGLSLGDFYEDPDLDGDDDLFGFFQTGVLFTLDFGGLTEGAGNWEVHAGAQFLFLGDNAAELNAGDDFEVIFVGGFSVSF